MIGNFVLKIDSSHLFCSPYPIVNFKTRNLLLVICTKQIDWIRNHWKFRIYSFRIVVGSGEDIKVCREMSVENMNQKNQIQIQIRYDQLWVDITVFKLTYLHSIVVCIFGRIFSRVISPNTNYIAHRIQLPIPKPQTLNFHE